MRESGTPYDSLVDHFAGVGSAQAHQRLRHDLASDVEARALFCLLLATEDQASDAPLARRDRLERVLFDRPKQRLSTQRFILSAAALVVCIACVSALLHLWPDPQRASRVSSSAGSGLQIKGGDEGIIAEDRYVSVVAYRHLRPSKRYIEVERSFRHDEPLAFAYSNGGPSPFTHLLVFGIDDRGIVYWYHPEFSDQTDSPRSVSIEAGSDIELPAQIRHRYQGSTLRVFALFSRRAIEVKRVEAIASRMRTEGLDPSRLKRFPIDGVGQHILSLEILR
jgi:hypothetical protein